MLNEESYTVLRVNVFAVCTYLFLPSLLALRQRVRFAVKIFNVIRQTEMLLNSFEVKVNFILLLSIVILNSKREHR